MGYGARSRVQSTERGSSMCRERNSGADEKRDEEKRRRRSQVRIFAEFSAISEPGEDLSPLCPTGGVRYQHHLVSGGEGSPPASDMALNSGKILT